MTAIIFAVLKRFGGWILAALSLAGALFVAMRSSRSVGKAVCGIVLEKTFEGLPP